jgi:hypothetical protein
MVWLHVIGLLLVLVWPSTALAQSKAGAAVAPKLESIRRYMEKGQAAYAAGNYQEAAQVFEQGYREHPYSAFLFNAGVAYQKLSDHERALANFREYLRVDPSAPDAQKVRERIRQLELDQQRGAGKVKPAATPAEEMKALVVVETQPPGAPLKIYLREQPSAPPFQAAAENPGWKLVATATAPANLTLDVGHYHLVVEAFAGHDATQTDLDVLAGRVLQFRAALSQGAFMSFLRVTSNVSGAKVYVDDRRKTRPPWGVAPYGALLGEGTHDVLVEAPGHVPKLTRVTLGRSEQHQLDVKLERVSYGRLSISAGRAELAVQVDGKLAGSLRGSGVPLELQLPAGSHRITLSSPGYKTYRGTVEIPRGQTLPVVAKMVPRFPRGAAWTQAVIGTVFVGAASVLGVESNRLYGEIEDDRDAGVLHNEDERISRGRIFAISADIGFAVGAVLGGLATYNFLRDPYPESSLAIRPAREFDAARGSRAPPEASSRASGRRRLAPGVSARARGSNAGLVLGGQF